MQRELEPKIEASDAEVRAEYESRRSSSPSPPGAASRRS